MADVTEPNGDPMRRKINFAAALDLLAVPFAFLASILALAIRRAGINRMPYTSRVFRRIGVYPIRDHYYEPLFNTAHLTRSLDQDRDLPGIDWNIAEQLKLLEKFEFNRELVVLPLEHGSAERGSNRKFFYNNGMFESGDAEYFYNVIRHLKPRRLIEIGSGQSTLLAKQAIAENVRQDPNSGCEHICIEPYEAGWLEQTGVKVIRERVEAVPKELFRTLSRGDILFIDSSHMIRPQGDVLFEYLEILPILQPGVFVHIHDIFSPRDYPEKWISQDVRFWNEQYLLEAFLNFNASFEIVGALNFLKHHYPKDLASCCPILSEQMDSREPGSFWIRRT
ncbi:class I SAM-dependent methyltransferase [Mycolicibacterium sp. GCM10028919]|uniref:class I SAM-dependent methyltransferase n=1 Tax=Mycolicibacterium sp. GCM10028919 TaxID=3273401 RepID=UPI003616D843